MKADFSPLVQGRFPEIAGTSHSTKSLQTAGTFRAGDKRRAISGAFASRRRPPSPHAVVAGIATPALDPPCP